MTELRTQWIEAAKKLISNPDAIVKCPECDQGTLKVIDVPIPDWNKIDRYVVCDSCGTKNVVTMHA